MTDPNSLQTCPPLPSPALPCPTLQLSPGVREHPELHTMLWVPHPCVVPGARFREVYYWDSYWVVKGLLVSGLCSIAQVRIEDERRERHLCFGQALGFPGDACQISAIAEARYV